MPGVSVNFQGVNDFRVVICNQVISGSLIGVPPAGANPSNTAARAAERGWPPRSSDTGPMGTAVVLSVPLNVHKPFVQSMNSFRSISEILLPLVFFQFFLYSTMINSTGAITYGADALFHDPQAVLREMLPSFQTMVEW